MLIQEKLRSKRFTPRVALTLGSGLEKLASLIKPVAIIPYGAIPHYPASTVAGHEGILIAGYLEGVPMIGLKGRKHYYEAAHLPAPMDTVVFPVHVVAGLGCGLYIATNASGGLNSTFSVGDLMVIKSHIGLFLPNPLLGPYHDFGQNPYFQPLADIYTPSLRKLFQRIDPSTREGVYVALTGRTFETQAEVLMLRTLGADCVGMSTVPEIIIAHNRGLATLGVSMVTNVIAKDGTNATSHEEVLAALHTPKVEEKLMRIFRTFFQRI
ncbi:hypothetical protein A2971_05040 [Candidatus Gottesmanbacteria bacterium RIFCSPLOWO2_01_FULL_46_21]|uniref:Purine nucleoside phosphorylase n=1 Tax=Candidatus Gottesmanbacteria bacterium RIFCSPLOWO2_01_FULL_46_21 TaxID=1798393 RepID=A0A1F6AWB2_9BACT|nr:MAG: hypothetical protein A2971_05040 [Candidatus Gottesmanbacteria bacterium RIFCSPLOWO2_01_FULL_46_21]